MLSLLTIGLLIKVVIGSGSFLWTYIALLFTIWPYMTLSYIDCLEFPIITRSNNLNEMVSFGIIFSTYVYIKSYGMIV